MARNGNHERQGAASSTSGMPPWLTNPVDLWSPFLNSMQSWSGTMAPKVTTLSTEWMAFVQRRVKEDFALPQHLVTCKAPGEVVQTYADFFRKAMEDYQRQFEEMARLGAESANDRKDPEHVRLEPTAEKSTREPRANSQPH